jgi:hypothetical protein
MENEQLESYPFLTHEWELRKCNLYGIFTGAILDKFSNARP